MSKKSPLKHREKGVQSHDKLSAGEHWDAHSLVKDKPGYQGGYVPRPGSEEPVIPGLPTKEDC